jgi:hypothetical protein
MTQARLIRFLRYAVLGETKHPRGARRRPRRGPARSWKYRGWIRTLPSAVSGALGCEAAHTGDDGGMGQKPSDYSCIPLTFEEHCEYHNIEREAFESRYGISCRQIVGDLNRLWFKYARLVK